MTKYLIEFTAWLEVTAKNEDKAYDEAMKTLENLYPHGDISLGDFEERNA